MEIKGKVIQNLGLQSGTSKAGKAWSKASIVIETEGQYPKKVALDNLKNAEEFGKLAPGSVGTFHIEIISNEFNGRWYTSVNCYKWETASPYPQQQAYTSQGYESYQPQAPQPPYPVVQPLPEGAAQETDDLPF